MQTSFTNASGVKKSSGQLNLLIDETHRLCIYIHDDQLLQRVEQVAAICTKPAHVVNDVYLLLRERGIDKDVLLSDDFIRALLPYLNFKVGVKTLHNLFLRCENML